jgi:Malectin domain
VNGDRASRRCWCAPLFSRRPWCLVPVAGLALAALLVPVNGGGGAASAATTIYLLNAGGGQVAGTPPWSPDTPFVSGSALSTYSTSASITLDSSVQGVPAALFQTERWSADDRQPMTYRLPASSGSYRVRLYFAEIWSGAFTSGARQFNVDLNGQRVLTNYDIFAEVGANRGTVKTFDVTTSNGINVVLTHVAGRNNPKISGLGVVQLGSTPPPTTAPLPPTTTAPTTTTTTSSTSTTSTTVSPTTTTTAAPPTTTTTVPGSSNCTSYQGPVTISTGGSYTGCWSSNNPNTPAVNVTTSSPVSIVNSGIQSKGHGIQLAYGGRLTVRGSDITILNPGVAGVVKSRWIYGPRFASATIENNDLTSGRGVFLSDWTGTTSDGVKFRYNRIRNVDGRTSSGSGYTNDWNMSTGYGVALQLANSRNIPNVEVAWNEVVNTPGQSAVEDNFSFWMSSGTPSSPIYVHDNYVQGSWRPDIATNHMNTGTAINTADGDGTGSHSNAELGYMLVERNVATGVANLCYGLSYGHDITVRNNRCVVSGNADWDAGPRTDIRLIAQSDWAVGLGGPWNSTGTPGFENNSMRDNVSSLWNRTKGVRNDWWMPDCVGVCTGNVPLHAGEITLSDEINEHNMWLQRVSSAGVRIGRA